MRRKRIAIVLLGLALIASACAKPVIDTSERAADRVRAQDVGTYPYHPVVFHLDLSILAYQLYAQTLVWPFDPYYEQAADRDDAMRRVWEWVEQSSPTVEPGRDGLRGPGALSGHPSNRAHDPILFRYGAIEPWSAAISTSSGERWTTFEPARPIVDGLIKVLVAYRAFGVLPKRFRRRLIRVLVPTYTVGALCVVSDEAGRLLLVRHSYRAGWGFPGGMLKHGETPADAARREIREELDLRIELVRGAVPLVLPVHRRVDLVYRAEALAGSRPRAASAEIADVAWFERRALPHLDTTAHLVLTELDRAEAAWGVGSDGNDR